MNLIKVAEELISVDSSPEVGNSYVCDHLLPLIETLGLKYEIETYNIDGVEQKLLYVFKQKRVRNETVFWTNLQTNNPGIYSYWDETDSNPYRLTIKGDTVYGLGTCSGKLDFLSQIYALSSLKDGEGKGSLLVGGFGSLNDKEGAKAFLKANKEKPRAIIVSEPTNLKFCKDYSGSVVVRIFLPLNKDEKRLRDDFFEKEATATQTKIFKGEPHFAFQYNVKNQVLNQIRNFLENLPNETMVLNIEIGDSPYITPSDGVLELDLNAHPGQNLKSRLLELLNAIDAVFKERFTKYVRKYDLFNFPSYNLGFVRTTPEGVEMEGCFFLTHGVDKDRVRSWLKLLDKQQIEVSLQHYHAASRLPPDHELEKDLKEIVPETKFGSLQHIQSDTSFFLSRGFPALGFGPGSSEGYNIINEYNSLKQIKNAENIYGKIMRGISL